MGIRERERERKYMTIAVSQQKLIWLMYILASVWILRRYILKGGHPMINNFLCLTKTFYIIYRNIYWYTVRVLFNCSKILEISTPLMNSVLVHWYTVSQSQGCWLNIIIDSISFYQHIVPVQSIPVLKLVYLLKYCSLIVLRYQFMLVLKLK